MDISSLSKYLQELQNAKQVQSTKSGTSQSTTSTDTNTDVSALMDMYIPSNVTGTEVLCSDNYNDMFGQQRQSSFSSMLLAYETADSTASSTTSTTSTDSTSDTSDTEEATAESFASVLNQISQTMRVNTDSIAQTMSELGLSASDLYDSDSMSKLVSALNSKASEMGLQTVDDTDSAASSLSSYAQESQASVSSTYSLTDDQWQELMDEFTAIMNGTSTDSTDTSTATNASTASTTSTSSTSKTSSTDSTTSTASSSDEATADSIDSILDQISDTMRVNKDSILQVMSDLGLTASNLYNSDSMSQLVEELNNRASEMGLQSAGDTATIAASLSDYASESASSIQSQYSLTDSQWEELLEKFSSIWSSATASAVTAESV